MSHEALHDAMHAPEPDDEPDETPGLAPDDEAAEAEEADETTPEPEPDAFPESSEQGPSEADWEKRNKKAETSFNTYTRALARIYEDDFAQLARCPLCLGPTPGHVVIAAAGRVPDDQADLVKRFLGLAREIDYEPSPEHRACGTCQALGKVATGSRVPGNEVTTCPTCKGYGFQPPPGAPQNGPAQDGTLTPLVSLASPDLPTPEEDDWHQPRILPDGRENPNFGRTPQYWVRVEPWGDTRNLAAQDAVK